MNPILHKANNPKSQQLASSFRDPDGFLFYVDGTLYRQINEGYQKSFELLENSGLLDALVSNGQLVSHTEIDKSELLANVQDDETRKASLEQAYKVIKPKHLPFISYPYEWSFSQLKDAALLTLNIQKQAIAKGMSLKDASAYNVQFLNHQPVFIDTLSFEAYEEGSPWVAYQQFCQHFLAPLALMAIKDVRLNQLLQVYIDGIPLDLASTLLPAKTRINLSLLTHIHFHANTQKQYESKEERTSKASVSKMGLLGIIDNLESTIKNLEWRPKGTEWGDYYSATNYSSDAFENKKALVNEYIQLLKPKTLWDLGANTGEFTRIASEQGIHSIAFDIDPAAVEKNYRSIKSKKESNLLPLLLDLTNPSPGLGWANTERDAFNQRGPVDTAMALALIHHLAISNNLPLGHIAQFFSQIANSLIIEFVPKSDSQVKRLLSTREDIFPNYIQPVFEHEFGKYFHIKASASVQGSDRTLYALVKK